MQFPAERSLTSPPVSEPTGEQTGKHSRRAMLLRSASLATLLWQPLRVRGAGGSFSGGDWEITPNSEAALDRGLDWLAKNAGPEGNWNSKHLGLVGVGALAFLAAGHLPGRGRYGETVERAIAYLLRNAKPSGLLNIDQPNRDMYNHGLATFVLGQAHGITNDPRIASVLDRALKLIFQTQCRDGGWNYEARSTRDGHDLSLAVMQAKAIRSAMDCGFNVPSGVIRLAIRSVREHYKPEKTNARSIDDPRIKIGPGQFTYDGNRVSEAMSAAGVVCLQEFGQYDDWRIEKNLDYLTRQVIRNRRVADLPFGKGPHRGAMPFDAYTLYYIGQAMYQAGGDSWRTCYPLLRDGLVNGQFLSGNETGAWNAGKHVGGREGQLYGTSVACFILGIPNRYLPILQEGRIESVRKQVGG